MEQKENKRLLKEFELLKKNEKVKLLTTLADLPLIRLIYAGYTVEIDAKKFPYGHSIKIVSPVEFEMPNYKRSPIKCLLEQLNSFLFDSSYLLLGGYPVENSRERPLYSNSMFYVANVQEVKNTNTFKERYFQLNFNNLDEIKKFVEKHRRQFDVVLFDWSTFKFFDKNDTFQDRLLNLLELPKKDGLFIIETPRGSIFSYPPTISMRNVPQERERQKKENLERLTKVLDLNGYSYQLTTADKTHPIAQKVYARDPSTELMVIRDIIPYRMGGKRRTRRSKKSKGTRRH